MNTTGRERTSPCAPLWKPLTLAIAGAIVAPLVVASWAWWCDREARALLALSPAARMELYTRNLDDMKTLCASPTASGAFTDRCEERALFLARFPECGDECRRLIEPYSPRPSR